MIKVLPKDVADKIAAGEVIESPVSIVKELIENSIDAKSTQITCEITKGGKESIRITDNGMGIPKEEVYLAFLRHSTSKIRTAEDLNHLTTLGFRGEALASIAAVSRVEMITKTAEEQVGTRIIIHGGNIVSEDSIGCPTGTTIIVEDLFYNVPARQKFLKSEAAEAGKIIDMMSRLAITRPDIRFTMISNGKNFFTTIGNNDLKRAIMAVYKDREYSELVETNYHADNKDKSLIRVSGYISRPSFTRTNRRSQYVFVNGRPIKNKSVDKGIDLGYKERLFDGRFPITFLFIDIDPEKVDINVHPNKKEVRFKDEISVVDAVASAINQAILTKESVIRGTDTVDKTHDLASADASRKTNSTNSGAGKTSVKKDENRQVDIKQFLSTKSSSQLSKTKDADSDFTFPTDVEDGKNTQDHYYDHGFKSDNTGNSPGGVSFREDNDAESLKNAPFDFDELIYLGTVLGTYIIASDNNNMYLIDQHAAHERVNYEKFMAEYHAEKPNSQVILTPFTFDVTSDMTVDDSQWTEILMRMGFSLELFGDNTYRVMEIPTFLTLVEAEEFVKSFVDSYNEDLKTENNIALDKLITRACKSSIKANDYIKHEEIDALILQLKNCANPFSCPHGRPTFIKFSKYELEKMFKRLG